MMKYVIRILIPDCTEPSYIEKYKRDLSAFCRVAQIRKPVPQSLPSGDALVIDLKGLSEYKQLLWLHILCDLAALNHHYIVELYPLPDAWPLQEVY